MAGVLVVTGTGTGVGKTVVTAALAARAAGLGQRVAVVKPVQTGVGPGETGDVAEVRRLAGPAVTGVELARYAEPLAPATAARRCGRPVPPLRRITTVVEQLTAAHDLVLVEGAGGLLVRFDDTGWGLAEVAAALAAPVLVVAAAGLGTLNATALTTEAARTRGLTCQGVVVGSWPAGPGLAERCNLADLPNVCAAPLLGRVPADAGRLSPAAFRAGCGSWLSAGCLPGVAVPQ